MNEDNHSLEKAARDSWKSTPMPEKRARLSFQREFSQDEVDQLSLGLIPHVMEDKWFIFLKDDQLFFHRSWTGVCIYQLQLKKGEMGYSVSEAYVNRDKEQGRSTDDEYDASLLSFLIDNLLLGKSTPFPLPGKLPKKIPKGMYQHSIAGTAYPEITTPTTISLLDRVKWFFRNPWV